MVARSRPRSETKPLISRYTREGVGWNPSGGTGLSDANNTGSQRRDHFRIVYPKEDRPRFTSGGLTFWVVDLAEQGMKFRSDGVVPWHDGDALRGRIAFHDDGFVDVEGNVLRHVAGNVVATFTRGVPLARIMEEQRWLIRKQKSLP